MIYHIFPNISQKYSNDIILYANNFASGSFESKVTENFEELNKWLNQINFLKY